MTAARIEELLNKMDDLRVVADGGADDGFTLTAIMRNEMHFLPQFLPHYRKLGVSRFVVLDDRSDDGTREYLAAQPDVITLESNYRYKDRLRKDTAELAKAVSGRVPIIWRNILLRNFAKDVWSIHVDADEFLDLPDKMDLPSLARKLDGQDFDMVWSAMIDMYPAGLQELYDMRDDPVIDFDRPWYFDGCRHLLPVPGFLPRVTYAGSRARLMMLHGLNPKSGWLHRRCPRLFRRFPMRYNAIRKPAFLRFRDGMVLRSPHNLTGKASVRMTLPLRHYKFNGAIADRIAWALETKGYSGGSAEYQSLQQLLGSMDEGDGSFVAPVSRRYTGFRDFAATGNAMGFR
ncbi:MAG: glycosyltransferase family 2 protein [Pseudomonadota bacterium]